MKKIIPEDCVLVPDNAKLVFKGMIFDTYQWQQEMFDGTLHTFEMLKRTDTVSAICVVEDKILVIKDEQPHLGERESFPGGRVDAEDDSIQAADEREVLEETGYSFNNWKLIKVWQPYRKMEWFVHVWVAWDLAKQVPPQVDPGEKITVEKLTIEAVKQKVMGRVGYLSESAPIFENVDDIAGLLAVAEFSGQVVDR